MLLGVFETPELADQFIRQIVKGLNGVTFNGQSKINKVTQYGVAGLHVPEKRTGFGTIHKSAYTISLSKQSPVTLDDGEAIKIDCKKCNQTKFEFLYSGLCYDCYHQPVRVDEGKVARPSKPLRGGFAEEP